MTKKKASKLVKTVLLGSPVFLSGCGCTVTHGPAYYDGVPVVGYAQPNYHYSAYYGGYVPLIVPIGGFHNGVTYHNYYNTLPPEDRKRYTPPTRSTVPSSGTTAPTAAAASKGGTSTPASGTSRGIAGGIGAGSASS